MRILLLNQCFYPDIVSTAQHLTDLAVALAERGHSVTVVASRRGYDDPSKEFSAREEWRSITIVRIPSLALGKKTKLRRILSFASYLASCVLRLAILPKFDVVVAMTSPPLISYLGALFVRLKGGRFVFWVMDLNPDEAIAAGWLREQSTAARVLGSMLHYSLQHAERIVALDRFMLRRIADKGIPEKRIVVIPPWSHDDAVQYNAEGRQSFRSRHGLAEKFVVMYSGNHSPCHPLDTLLQAAEQLADHRTLAFCFVGGGSEFNKVRAFAEEKHLGNIICLPYQPLDELAASLSSADLHVVVMGESFVGIIHPCKIYNILAIGLPSLIIGPAESHLSDIVREASLNGRARIFSHGQTEALVKHLQERAQTGMPAAGPRPSTVAARFSKTALLPRMIETIESAQENQRDATNEIAY
jgi:glycosyltransferase involved in cell wall biosynthesis